MSLDRSLVVPYAVAVVVVPLVAYVAQPAQCFWYFYGPKIVPVFIFLAVATGSAQHLSATNARAKLACAIAFAAGIPFTLIVPCFDAVEPSRTPALALWSLLFGGAAAIGMLVVASGMLRGGAVLRFTAAAAGIGQSLSALSILTGVIAVYLGIVSDGDSWLLRVTSSVNHPLILLSGLLLTGVGSGASLWGRRSQK